MQIRKEISDELALISEVVSSIPFGNVYIVPDSYFEALPVRILEQLQAENLSEPLISGLSHSNVQEVPEGYFNSLASTILQKALASDKEAAVEIEKLSPQISGIGRSMPYVLPEAYFNHLPQLVMDTINGKQVEQEEIPAFLRDLRNKNPYTVPENYFPGLPAQILKRITTPSEAQVVKMFSFRRIMQYASAAVMAGVILAGSLLYFRGSSDTDAPMQQQISSFDSIPIEELETYVNNQPVINSLNADLYTSADLEKEDIREILFDVPEADLQQYLVNYTDINPQNIN